MVEPVQPQPRSKPKSRLKLHLPFDMKRVKALRTRVKPYVAKLRKALDPAKLKAMALEIRADFSGLRSALHLDESAARLLVLKGAKPLRWDAAPIPAGVFQDGVVHDPQALVFVLDGLFTKQRAPRSRVLLSVGGLHTVMRTFRMPVLKPQFVEESLRRQLKREVSLPLDNHHTVWETTPLAEGQMEALTLSIPNAELNSVMGTLKTARIRPQVMEWDPLAVARAINVSDAAILVMSVTGFDIIVVRHGVPEVARNVAFASRDANAAQRVEQMSNELLLTLSYTAGEREGDAQSAAEPKLFLLGQAAEQPVRELLSNATGKTVEGWTGDTAGFPASEYAANLGVAMREKRGKLLRRAQHIQRVVAPNLIPPQWRPRNIPVRQAAYGATLAIALGSLISPLSHAKKPDPETVLIEQRTALVTGASESARAEVRALRRVQKDTTALEQKLSIFRAGLASVESQDLVWPDLVRDVPPQSAGVTLLTVSETKTTVDISGRADSYDTIVQYARKVLATRRFQRVTITNISDSNPDAVFDLTADKPSTQEAP